SLLERGDAFYSELFHIARHLVRMPIELKKPNADRLREYRDSNLESLKFQLFSPAPIHPELERAKLAASLTFLAEQLGGGHPLVEKILAGKNPANRAAELVAGTKLADPAERKKLSEGGTAAVEGSDDAMIRLARLIDDEARKLRKRYEDEVEEPERQAYAKIAEARFKVYGRNIAPDATFTLRLAFGVVKGYEVDGERLLYATTFRSAFARAEKQGYRPPFDLPARWRDGKDKLDLDTPFNFVSTADTIGGNSGSPVLNRAGELVGLNFDRNRHGLVRNFVYTDEQARHIAVHSRAVPEALRRLYDAGALVRELTGGE
ncbi:MAG TPA: S46 family peptidase, partial [Gemmataceae bacterium]|nr:S46 family peptidase [Gemmataceae bacterium]